MLDCHLEAPKSDITVRNPFHSCSRPAIVALALSFCFAQVLTAQVSSPGRRAHFNRIVTGSKSRYGIKAPSSIAEVLPPNSAELRQPTVPLTIPDQPSDSYRSPVNLKLLLPQSQTFAGVAKNERGSAAHTQRPEFAESSASPAANTHTDDLEYYTRHVPVVGGFMQHVVQESKAHPHVTRVFQYIHPEF